MKRWNGWGNTATTYAVPAAALEYLKTRLGELTAVPDVEMNDVLPSIPPSRLPSHPMILTDPETRLRHARGQSLPDWIALRSGHIPAFPDGVAVPGDEEQVRELLSFSRRTGVPLIPYGGGTSVVGHINPPEDGKPVVTLDLGAMNQMLGLEEVNRLAVFEAGVTGPELERKLSEHGYTLGHFPQSHEYSTLGGWIAARSRGQQSFYYGRIEQLFAGGRVETPRGTLELPHYPSSAAGPDLKELVLGSEGRLGVITQAAVRVRPRPEAEEFHGVFFTTWDQGTSAVRSIAQQGIPVSMLRLSSPLETEVTLILSGKSWVNAADHALRMIGFGEARCLLIFGLTGKTGLVNRTRREAVSVCRRHGGLFVGKLVGHTWQKSRFLSPYLRNTLWECGVAVDTLETALSWKNLEAAARSIPQAMQSAQEAWNERVLIMSHLSHVYTDGVSLYITYLFRRKSDPEQLLSHWRSMKQAASSAIQRCGGTISHQHGIGEDHRSYLPAEKGKLGMEALQAAIRSFDPQGLMNPGKLF